MRYIQAGEWIENPAAGARLRFTVLPQHTGGRQYEAEFVIQPYQGRTLTPLHYHPTITETFTVVSGQAGYRRQSQEHPAAPGERIVLAANVPHQHPWSTSAAELHLHLLAESASADVALLNRTLNAVITGFGLARDGKTDKTGQPRNLLQAVVMAAYAAPGFYPAGLPLPLLRPLLGTLAALGRAAGLRPTYAAYGEIQPA